MRDSRSLTMIPHEVCISSQICQLCQLSLETNADDHPPSQIDLASPELPILMTPFDLKRMESYANNMLDYHVILDLVPTIATLFFERRLIGTGEDENVHLSAVQSAILGPSVFTAPRAFPTSFYRSYYNDPTATTAQPQPIITDPVSVSFISDLPLLFSRLLPLARTKSIRTGSRIQRPYQG